MFHTPPRLTDEQIVQILRIPISFKKIAGRPLIKETAKLFEALWEAPIAIVAHDNKPDPIFFYGNALALKLFEMDFKIFTQLPSRLSAEPLRREERSHFLEYVQKAGIIYDYEGIRISANGRKFLIQNAMVWNIANEDGTLFGQAAAIPQWRHLGK